MKTELSIEIRKRRVQGIEIRANILSTCVLEMQYVCSNDSYIYIFIIKFHHPEINIVR